MILNINFIKKEKEKALVVYVGHVWLFWCSFCSIKLYLLTTS